MRRKQANASSFFSVSTRSHTYDPLLWCHKRERLSVCQESDASPILGQIADDRWDLHTTTSLYKILLRKEGAGAGKPKF